MLDIQMVLLDVDGVLTDGGLWFDSQGEEIKRFSVRDGLGIKMLQKNGIIVGIITGRSSKSLSKRLEELKIELVYQGVGHKIDIYREILKNYNLKDSQISYMGDDLPDLDVLKNVGLAACPKDAVTEVKLVAKFCASQKGGHGAVRELAEFILKSQGKWISSNDVGKI